jgi:hypothetical protein
VGEFGQIILGIDNGTCGGIFLLIHVLVRIDISEPYWSSPRGLVGCGFMLAIVIIALYRMILTIKASDFISFS